jgi:hypothetical protein
MVRLATGSEARAGSYHVTPRHEDFRSFGNELAPNIDELLESTTYADGPAISS